MFSRQRARGTAGAAPAPASAPAVWSSTRAELLRALGTTTAGLSSAEASARLARDGPNEPAAAARRGPWRVALGYLASPLNLTLFAAAALAFVLGQVVDGVLIGAMVVAGVAIDFAQTWRSERTIDRLRARLAPTATALRDGAFADRPRSQIVRGDVIRLTAGDVVPADARLLDARDLHAQQAVLTGESLPLEKDAAAAPGEELLASPCIVLAGTSVVSGYAEAVVFATGARTAFGEIAASLARRAPETEFDRGARQLGVLITRTVALLVLFVLLCAAAFHRPAFESLLFAVALAVGLTPEFLPMITTVTLSRGAAHMARRHVVVKSLAAMQNLGSIDVLCSDKTGTLTTGMMRLDRALDGLGGDAARPLELAWLNSAHQTGVKSPLDAAVLDAMERAGGPAGLRAARKLDEVPFDFERRRVSVVVEAGARLLVTKGSPESILPLCRELEAGGARSVLDDLTRARCRATFDALSDQGLRVLAVAFREVAARPAYRASDERDLVLAGFLAFWDPPVAGLEHVVKALARDGVQLKVVTGDNELVAAHACRRIGIEPDGALLGPAIDRMTDGALGHAAERASLFARVSPAQKSRIIHALRARGHSVGFLGDGINDAPSLHAADVGISVSGAVDVARDAAEVILLDRSLAVLHAGIVEGRRAFGNVVKYLLMGTSSNFGNMASMAAAFLFLPFLPMLPTQILLLNALYDLAQVTIPTDRVEPRFVRKPRRWDARMVRNFMLTVGPLSSLFDFFTFFALLHLFRAGEALFHTGWFIESAATQTLVIFVIRASGRKPRSRPSAPLTATAIGGVVAALALTFTPLGRRFGFVPPPALLLAFVAAVVSAYLALVAVVRRRLFERLGV